MEARTRRQAIVLGALVGVLAVVLWWNLGTSAGPGGGAGAGAARRQGQATTGGVQDTPIESVRLDALAAPRPAPGDQARDPFRFRTGGEAPPAAAPSQYAGTPDADAQPGGGEPIVSGPPPIPLRYIGVVRLAEGQRLLAVLSDGNGVYRGSAGDVIEGRYRILQVRPESIEIAYVDGSGQQVIRLSGS